MREGRTDMKKKLSFEAAMERLEQIVARLEEGDAPLEESLALFTEGTELARRCGTALDQAEQQVKKLFPGADGAPAEEPFEPEEGSGE